MKLFVYRDETVWVRYMYVVEADSAEEAMQKVDRGEYTELPVRQQEICPGEADPQFHKVKNPETDEILWQEAN